jgi:hypothetical protein
MVNWLMAKIVCNGLKQRLNKQFSKQTHLTFTNASCGVNLWNIILVTAPVLWSGISDALTIARDSTESKLMVLIKCQFEHDFKIKLNENFQYFFLIVHF